MINRLPLLFIVTIVFHSVVNAEQETVVYDFPIQKGDSIDNTWTLRPTHDCKPAIEQSPNGKRTFLAKIPVGKQSLKLTKLPTHTHVRVQFDLIIKGTWDGDHKEWGPDIWKFDIDGREPLVNSTFCNQVAEKKQSFPDYVNNGHTSNQHFTGAIETAKLGYMWRLRQADPEVSLDATYRFNFLVPHHQKTLQLNFQSTFHDVEGEPNHDQWYGLDNVKITTVNQPEQLSTKAVTQAISQLTSSNAIERYKARVLLLGSDQSFLQAIQNRFKNKKSVDLNHLITKLDHDSYATREAATKELLSLTTKHYQSILQALDQAEDPEIIARLQFIVKEGQKHNKQTLYTEIRRLLLIIDTPAAKQILKNQALGSI